MLRVATFNIRHGRPQGGRGVDLTGLAAAVALLDADVLGLQEVDVGVPRSGRCDLAGLAAGACPDRNVHFARATGVDGGDYGNALVVRGDVLEAADHRLPGRGETRVVTIARVRCPSDPSDPSDPSGPAAVELTVAVTHLSTPRADAPDQAERQLERVLELMDGAPGPQLLMGDLNLGPADVLAPLSARGWTPAVAGPTFPARRPSRRIDWLACRGPELRDAWVPALVASDHRPLVATVVAAPG